MDISALVIDHAHINPALGGLECHIGEYTGKAQIFSSTQRNGYASLKHLSATHCVILTHTCALCVTH